MEFKKNNYTFEEPQKASDKNKNIWALILTVFLAATVAHFVYWGQFSLDVVLLKTQNLVGLRSSNSYYTELGSVCNALNKLECSKKYFEKLLLENPKNTKASGNLAVAYFKSGQNEMALTYFNQYQDSGGKAFDIIFWHGKALLKNGDKEGLRNIIYSVGLNQKDKKHITEVVNVLADYGKQDLALSLIGSVSQGSKKKIKEWDNLMSQPKLLNYKSMERGWEALSFNTRTFYSPLKLKPSGRIKIFELEFWDEHNLISYEVLDENRIPYNEKAEKVSVKLKSGRIIKALPVQLDKVYVSGIEFKNIKFYVCQFCNNQLGKSFLSQFYTEKIKTQRVNYIKFKLKDYLFN